MNDSADIVEPADRSSMERRQFLARAAAAGAIAWTAPVIRSRAAYGVEGGEGTPKCQPTVKVCCTRYWCGQSQKYFPGIHIVVSSCPCAPGTCATACVKIARIEISQGSDKIIAYGPGTTCGPTAQGGTDVTVDFSDGDWRCLTSSTTSIFFGKERGGDGAIGDIGGASVCFDLAVWAGCPDFSPQSGPSYVCETHRYCVALRNQPDQNIPHCSCDNPDPPVNLCGGMGFSPCSSLTPTCGPPSTCSANPPCPPSTGTDPNSPTGDPTPIPSTPITCPSAPL